MYMIIDSQSKTCIALVQQHLENRSSSQSGLEGRHTSACGTFLRHSIVLAAAVWAAASRARSACLSERTAPVGVLLILDAVRAQVTLIARNNGIAASISATRQVAAAKEVVVVVHRRICNHLRRSNDACHG
jgi:hypothetical protein